jgi:NDP-sugar pyrophosphorylase family protein
MIEKMNAMIFAAGLGTRLQPITNSIPKAMVPVGGKSLLEHTILRMKNAGFNSIIINVHHYPDQIIDFLRDNNNFGISIFISDERNQLLDTGGAIKKVSLIFQENEPLLIHNVDIFSSVDLNKLYQEHKENQNRLATLVVSSRETARYLLFDDNNRLKGWVNKQTKETKPTENLDISQFKELAFSGIQVVSPSVFELMKYESDKFSIIDFYLKHCVDQEIIGYVPDNFQFLDVGKLDAIKQAEKFLQKNR